MVEQDLDAGELPVAPEQTLRPADVHRADARVAPSGGGVGQPDQETDHHRLILAVDLERERVADLQPVQLGELVGDGERLRVAQPRSQLQVLPVLGGLPADGERGKRQVGVDVQPQDLQVLAGKFGQGGVPFDQRRRGFHARHVGQFGQQRLVEAPARRAHLQVGLARHEVDARGKRLVGAVVGDLDGEVNRHAQCHAQHVQTRQQGVAARVPGNVPEEQARKLGSQQHGPWKKRKTFGARINHLPGLRANSTLHPSDLAAFGSPIRNPQAGTCSR